jgi:hypothetical protein
MDHVASSGSRARALVPFRFDMDYDIVLLNMRRRRAAYSAEFTDTFRITRRVQVWRVALVGAMRLETCWNKVQLDCIV